LSINAQELLETLQKSWEFQQASYIESSPNFGDGGVEIKYDNERFSYVYSGSFKIDSLVLLPGHSFKD
jgi:hypothetical protein